VARSDISTVQYRSFFHGKDIFKLAGQRQYFKGALTVWFVGVTAVVFLWL
jgi:hypothetical protein